MRFLATRASSKLNLMGSTNIEAAQVDSWLEYVWCSLDIAIAAEKNDLTPDHLSGPLEILDKHLQNKLYIVGESITIADISLVVSLFMANVDLSNHDNLRRLFEIVKELPAFQKALYSFAIAT